MRQIAEPSELAQDRLEHAHTYLYAVFVWVALALVAAAIVAWRYHHRQISGWRQRIEQIAHNGRVETDLMRARDDLDSRVQERTTALIEASQALADSEQRFRDLFASSPTPLLELDGQHRIRGANPAAASFDTVYTLDYDATGVTGEAQANETGSIWGIAYHPATDTIFTSALIKRHAGMGPGGPDAIYAIGSSVPAGWATPFTAVDTDGGAGRQQSLPGSLPRRQARRRRYRTVSGRVVVPNRIRDFRR